MRWWLQTQYVTLWNKWFVFQHFYLGSGFSYDRVFALLNRQDFKPSTLYSLLRFIVQVACSTRSELHNISIESECYTNTC